MKKKIMPLQKSCVYGPLTSRRFGQSLGINLLATDEKICNFNCLYCQYGWTDQRKITQAYFPPASGLIAEIEQSFLAKAETGESIDAVTFSGNGEPTLHPEFESIVPEVRRLRNQYLPKARLGILSNASQVYRPSVREALELFDECYMKLDAGDALTFSRINNPVDKKVCWQLTLDGLKKLHRNIILQSLFISFPFNNAEGAPFLAWLDQVAEIRPQAVHLYSLDRLPAFSETRPVSRDTLLRLAEHVQALQIPAEVF